jgi:alkylation response protein AidB-like acyl-CoA dehydrogenase
VDFEFDEDQELLRESVRRALAALAPIAEVRDHLGGPVARDRAWGALVDLGLVGMLVPESAGGAGRGMVDLALGLGEMGRAVYPGPFAASAVGAVGLLGDLGDEALSREWLPRLAAGDAIGTVGFVDASSAPLRLEADGTVQGAKVHVPDAGRADLLLLTTTAIDDVVVALTPATPGVTITDTPTVDGTRSFARVDCTGAHPITAPRPASAAVAATRDRLAVAYVLDGVGAAERALELAVDYAKERHQFGVPIGSFQAVQHLCADMLRAVELGRAAAYYAAWACDAADPTERHRAATMAQAFAADAFYGVAASAIQVFGGIGFTWEHDLHLFYKRLLTLQHFLGSRSDHLEELASLVL